MDIVEIIAVLAHTRKREKGHSLSENGGIIFFILYWTIFFRGSILTSITCKFAKMYQKQVKLNYLQASNI